jgi:hypothetical protein
MIGAMPRGSVLPLVPVLVLLLLLGVGSPAGADVGIEILAITGAPVAGEPGVNFGAPWGDSFIDDAGGVAFRASVQQGVELWTFGPDGQGGIRPFVRPGDPFPGRPGDSIQGTDLADLDESGRVLLRIEGEFEDLCPPHCGRARALVSVGADDTIVHALPGDAAPGIPGASFSDFFGTLSANDAGAIVFDAYIEGAGTGTANDQGLWRPAPGGGFALVAREGDPAPQAPPGWAFGGFSQAKVDDAGRVAFHAGLSPPGGVGPIATAIYQTDESGVVSEVARGGGQAPGVEAGVLFRTGIQSASSIFGPDRVVLIWELDPLTAGPSEDHGLWGSDAQGQLSLIAREGGPAPGLPDGFVFRSWDPYVVPFGSPAANEAGEVVFVADTAEPGQLPIRGLWRWRASGGLERLATTGDPLPDHPDTFLLDFGSPRIDAAGNLAGRMLLSGPDVGAENEQVIVWRDAAGPFRAILRAGAPLVVAPGDVRTVASLADRIAMNDARQIAFDVTFTDGSSAVLRATVPSPPRWFAVAENPSLGPCVHCDSYVLPLTDPDDVAHALALIASGGAGPAPIAVAEIAAGADGVNRDVLAPGAPPWSWHVTRLQGFADNTAEIYDGWPGFVESDVAGWIENTRSQPGDPGVVGFWGYTVVAEVPEAGGAGVWAAAAALLVCARRRAGATRRTGSTLPARSRLLDEPWHDGRPSPCGARNATIPLDRCGSARALDGARRAGRAQRLAAGGAGAGR